MLRRTVGGPAGRPSPTLSSSRLTRLVLLVLVALTATAVPAGAQTPLGDLTLVPHPAAATAEDCSDGLRHDDGSFESGIRSSLPTKIVTRFRVTETSSLDRICVCWSRGSLFSDHSFDLVVFDDDGPGGKPGSLLARHEVEVEDVPPGPGTFFGFDLSSLDLTLPPGDVYVGVDALTTLEAQPHLCIDEDGPGAAPILGASAGSSSNWQDVRESLPDLRALGVRVKLEADPDPGPGPGPGPGTCSPSDTVLCIDGAPGDRRFRVELEYENPQATGSAHAVPLADLGVARGGLFWIGNRNNPEMLIKILNACAAFDRFWVFYAATTNQGLTTTVTDTVSGRVWRRTNPQGTAAAPIQDTAAFPCE